MRTQKQAAKRPKYVKNINSLTVETWGLHQDVTFNGNLEMWGSRSKKLLKAATNCVIN